MSRRKWELHILAQEFSWYTEEVDELIGKTTREHECADSGDLVVDAVWRACSFELGDLNEAASARNENEAKLAAEGQLTLSGREAVRAEIDKALTRKAEILEWDDSEIEDCYERAVTSENDSYRARKKAQGTESDRFAFFNEPSARADFAHWRAASIKSSEQAVALSFGKDPKVVSLESLGPLYRVTLQSPFREEFGRRHDVVERALASKLLAYPISGADFYLWAEQNNFPCSPELAAVPDGSATRCKKDWEGLYEAERLKVDALKRELASWKTCVDDLQPKRRKTFYKLALGMAIARFEHRTDLRSKSTTNIKEGLAHIGLDLSAEVIHDLLRDAAHELELDWTVPIKWSGVPDVPKRK